MITWTTYLILEVKKWDDHVDNVLDRTSETEIETEQTDGNREREGA